MQPATPKEVHDLLRVTHNNAVDAILSMSGFFLCRGSPNDDENKFSDGTRLATSDFVRHRSHSVTCPNQFEFAQHGARVATCQGNIESCLDSVTALPRTRSEANNPNLDLRMSLSIDV